MSQILLLSNPGKRGRKAKRAKSKRKSYRRRKSAKRTSSRRRSVVRVRARRNPSPRIVGAVIPTIKNGFVGALGGIGNDLLFGYGKGFLPVSLQSGMARHGIKLLTAVGVGILGNMVLRGKGTALATGAATVVLHEALKEQIAGFVPSLPLGAMDEPPGLLGYDAGYPVEGVGEYIEDGMGEYIEDGMGDADEGE